MKDRACGTRGKEAKSLSTKFLCENLKERYFSRSCKMLTCILNKQNGRYFKEDESEKLEREV
jgi:hypothetical protein